MFLLLCVGVFFFKLSCWMYKCSENTLTAAGLKHYNRQAVMSAADSTPPGFVSIMGKSLPGNVLPSLRIKIRL